MKNTFKISLITILSFYALNISAAENSIKNNIALTASCVLSTLSQKELNDYITAGKEKNQWKMVLTVDPHVTVCSRFYKLDTNKKGNYGAVTQLFGKMMYFKLNYSNAKPIQKNIKKARKALLNAK